MLAEQTARGRLDALLKEDGFIYGIFFGWNGDMGHGRDIGGNRSNGYVTGFDEEIWRGKLYNCRAMGFNMVKITLTENREGMIIEDDGAVSGIEPQFAANLKKILDICVEYGLNVSLVTSFHLSMSAGSYEKYILLSRHIADPIYTQTYIDHFLNPLMHLIKAYDNILLIDLFAEPEGDVYGATGNGGGLDRGTTWEHMKHFIRECGKAVKAADPHMPITASSGWRNYDNLQSGLYNDLGLDYIGVDIYEDDGIVTPAEDLKLTAPALLGEFGPASPQNWCDEFQVCNIQSFFKNAKVAGYAGGFYWLYGWAAPQETSQSATLVGPNGQLRPAAGMLRFAFLDRVYEKTGVDPLDRPAFIWSNDISAVKWFGSRGAVGYLLERSADLKRWEAVMQADEKQCAQIERAQIAHDSHMYQYADKSANAGSTHHYRVTALGAHGRKAVSDPITIMPAPPAANPPYGRRVGVTGVTCAQGNLIANPDSSLRFEADDETDYIKWFEVSRDTDYYFSWSMAADSAVLGDVMFYFIDSAGTRIENGFTPEEADNYVYRGATDVVLHVPSWDGAWYHRTYQFHSGRETRIGLKITGTKGTIYFSKLMLYQTSDAKTV